MCQAVFAALGGITWRLRTRVLWNILQISSRYSDPCGQTPGRRIIARVHAAPVLPGVEVEPLCSDREKGIVDALPHRFRHEFGVRLNFGLCARSRIWRLSA